MNTKQVEQFNTPLAHYFELGYTAGYSDGYCQACKDAQGVFTKAEIDFLVHEIAKDISLIEELISLAKYDSSYFYSFCNPEDEETSVHFKYLNEAKTVKRKLEKKRNKLAVIQSKLKKLRSA